MTVIVNEGEQPDTLATNVEVIEAVVEEHVDDLADAIKDASKDIITNTEILSLLKYLVDEGAEIKAMIAEIRDIAYQARDSASAANASANEAVATTLAIAAAVEEPAAPVEVVVEDDATANVEVIDNSSDNTGALVPEVFVAESLAPQPKTERRPIRIV